MHIWTDRRNHCQPQARCPHNVDIIFGRKIRRDIPGTFRTAIDRRDDDGVLVNMFYEHSSINQNRGFH